MQGGVVRMRLAGTLTAEAMRAFSVAAIEFASGAAPGFVFDYSGATVAASDEDLAVLVATTPANSPLRVPAAFIPGRHNAEQLQRHAVRMAWARFPRRLCTDTATAHAWVLDAATRYAPPA